MIARLLICTSIDKLREELSKTLASHLKNLPASTRLRQAGLNVNHPDLLYIQAGEKLGIAEAKRIKEFFSLKPYSASGRAVVLEDASILTHEAQNALLKTIEELSREAILILGASSDNNLLPTILSRCEIIRLKPKSDDTLVYHSKYSEDLEKLLNSSFEQRFEYIEKLKEREEFLHYMVYFFRQKMIEPITLARPGLARPEVTGFLKELLQAEEWAKQNVNIRAILEYLMLKLPRKD
ncbi:MAG: hypothetical protein PHV63_01685 [Candidatus Daviesbacteria bacterium]|nr:hypothetical protein [Candidatus Daviesbacteria bacterium]